MSTDAVRAALAELVACHTEEAGLTMSMVANRADFDAFMERCDQRLAAALDAARAALSAGDADVQTVPGAEQWAQLADDFTRWANSIGRREKVTLTANHCHSIASAIRKAIAAAPSPAMPVDPDKQLCTFYGVDTFPALVEAMEHHIKKLQAKLPQNDMPAATKTRFA